MDMKLVRTNLAPRTIMRGPGFLNAVMVIEHIIEHVAMHMGLDPVAVKERNFLRALPPSLVSFYMLACLLTDLLACLLACWITYLHLLIHRRTSD